MTKFIAIILWPVVYMLDVLSWLLGFQTFNEARDTSGKLFKRIMNRNIDLSEISKSSKSSILID